MLVLLSIAQRCFSPARLPLYLAAVVWVLSMTCQSAASAEEKPARLLDRQPFDRVTLDSASGNEVIDTLLLDLPIRRVPNPFPGSGSLELRRLSEPSVLYAVPWTSIARIELYEQLLLSESEKLTSAGDLSQAYDYLSFLYKNYPKIAGLDVATEQYLRQDARAAFAKKNYEETLTILLSLYDLNPKHQGLTKFVETVTDRLIAEHLASRDFSSARSVLDLLVNGFPQLRPANISSWRGKFEKGAARQLSTARKAIDAQKYLEARRALRRAIAILPSVAGAAEMLGEIDRQSPQIVVSVDQLQGTPDNPLDWTAARIAKLTQPKLLNLVGFGAEGGDYECRWAELESDDSGLELSLKLNDKALRQGISAEVLALELLRQADPAEPQFRTDFAGLLSNVEIRQGNLIRIHWQRSHVRPESLLSLNLRNLTSSTYPPGAYQAVADEENGSVNYQWPKEKQQAQGPKTIIERFYDNEEAAFADLLSGEVDVLARVPTWQIDRLQKTEGIVVSPYRLPTLHVLIPNYKKPIMGRREFRRALCYGTDRRQILNGILLGGERRSGFRVLSAPLPAGITLTDPVGYAYNQGVQPRTYEPRLAAVLAAVARNSLAKLAAIKANAAQPKSETTEETKLPNAPATPLVLAHPPNPVATTVCQTIKLQLDAIGIPIKLKPLASQADQNDDDYDLRYAELVLWEPIVDARRLLGPGGVAGNCSSSMSLALSDVDQANNWKQARARLKEVHQIAFNDLPVIPLWQTVDYFAHRRTLRGLGTTPVTLYQNVVDWQRQLRGTDR